MKCNFCNKCINNATGHYEAVDEEKIMCVECYERIVKVWGEIMELEIENEIKRQREIIDAVLKEFDKSCKEIQLLAIDKVNSWLISNRIQKEKNSRNDEPASSAQKKYMDSLEISYEPNISKKQAHKLISNAVGES